MSQNQIANHIANFNLSNPVDERPLSQRAAILFGAVNSALYQAENAIQTSHRLAARGRLVMLRDQARALREAVEHDNPGNKADLLTVLGDIDELLA
jgi:hypothetical protein